MLSRRKRKRLGRADSCRRRWRVLISARRPSSGGRPEVAERDLNLLREGGFHWVKQTFAWENIEGAGKGHLDWSFSDRVVQQVNSGGLKLLARISVDPQKRDFWAGLPPASADHFADYVFALASRYSCKPEAVGCIQAYQIWNEPNLSREWGHKRPNPAEYVYFLGRAYAAIKSANPNAIVISAGMAPTGDDNENAMPDHLYYEQMYEAMGGNSEGYFDALGVHGVGFAAPPELEPEVAAAEERYGGHRFFSFRHVEDIRAIMERYGDTEKQIVLLEFGWTSDPVNPNISVAWEGRGHRFRRAGRVSAACVRMGGSQLATLDWSYEHDYDAQSGVAERRQSRG